MGTVMKATQINGTVFPAVLSQDGTLWDSRTGEKAKADKWEEITLAEYDAMCDALGLD